MPGLPDGKPASVRCPHLTAEFRCAIFGQGSRPAVCSSLGPEPGMCGSSRDEALLYLSILERKTAP